MTSLFSLRPRKMRRFYFWARGEGDLLTQDREYMQMAIQLAKMARGQTNPNPAVGALLVKSGRVIGMGAHLKAGEAHAEIHALQMAGLEAKDSTMYVTLEPCAHHGKTPPCVDAIIRAEVKKVVVAMQDPFEKVAGLGISKLREAGIEVEVGVQHEHAEALNQPFFHFVKTGLPFVTLKLAATLDGYTAASTGDSLYITSTASREEVHRLRSRVDAIVVGVETVRKDDPQLTVRLGEETKSPVRIVLDSYLRIPMDSRLVMDQRSHTMIVTTELAPIDKEIMLKEQGIEVVRLPSQNEHVPLREAMRFLATKGYLHLLLEGGQRVASAFMEDKLVNQVWIFHAPKLLGGGNGLLSWRHPLTMQEAFELNHVEHRIFDQDVLTIGDVVYPDSLTGGE